ncbi:protein fem-1 homolog B-like isoform X2 [Protopterus annectens]|nr:protein fem-1 homolog B-like isoform X2 [Protopterus annectens]
MENLTHFVYKAAREGHVLTLAAVFLSYTEKEIRYLIEFATNENGKRFTPLIIAARNGHDKVVRLLLEHAKFKVRLQASLSFDDFLYDDDGGTALWYAAGAGHMEVVKLLVSHGMNVNHITVTGSTPLRAACFDGRQDIVKLLVENSANIHIPNLNGSTSLMIAAHRGHTEVVKYLLSQHSDPNAKTSCGNTALHFAAEKGHLEIVRELLNYKAVMVKNHYGMTPLEAAAESCKADVVEFFLCHLNFDRASRIRLLELLGASFANNPKYYSNSKAYCYFYIAMLERYENPNNIIGKEVLPPLEAYNNRTECRTLQELEAIKQNKDAMHMEGLMAAERILGSENFMVTNTITYRGVVYAEQGEYDLCINLWLHALYLRQKNNIDTHEELFRLVQIFSHMLYLNKSINPSYLEKVLSYTAKEIERQTCRDVNTEHTSIMAVNDSYEFTLYIFLYLVCISTKLVCNEDEKFRISEQISRLIHLEPRTQDGSSMLHLAFTPMKPFDDIHINAACSFPDSEVIARLILCGANVNAVDNEGTSPLHKIVQNRKPSR